MFLTNWVCKCGYNWFEIRAHIFKCQMNEWLICQGLVIWLDSFKREMGNITKWDVILILETKPWPSIIMGLVGTYRLRTKYFQVSFDYLKNQKWEFWTKIFVINYKSKSSEICGGSVLIILNRLLRCWQIGL